MTREDDILVLTIFNEGAYLRLS